MGVDIGGAGDQGIMFGYTTKETDAYLPLSIYLAHRLAERLTYVRQSHLLDYVLPDGKTQVTITYDDEGNTSVDTIVLSTQHMPSVSHAQLQQDSYSVLSFSAL